jgi:hypothetical protein
MKTASDVNIIFAYDDSSHLFHKNVCFFMMQHIRDNYLLLVKVKAHFTHTYSGYLKDSAIIIDKSIREHRNERRNSPSQIYKPSHLAISANITKKIDDYVNEKSRNSNFSAKTAKVFINQLLSEYSIPTLFEDDKAFGEFREKYMEGAEKKALDVLNRFLKFFNNKYESMNIEQYKTYDEWMIKIKKSPQNIFENKQDYEDIQVASEYFAYNKEFGKANFFTTDLIMGDSLKKAAREFKLEIGLVHVIKQ